MRGTGLEDTHVLFRVAFPCKAKAPAEKEGTCWRFDSFEPSGTAGWDMKQVCSAPLLGYWSISLIGEEDRGCKAPYRAINVLTSCAGPPSLTAMALHHVAVNLRDRVPPVAAGQEKKKPSSKRLLDLSRIGSRPEVRDEDLQRFKRQHGLCF